MRPGALGRKNWIHIGSAPAGPKIAAILSVVESCRRLKLPVRDYLAAVLPGLADCPNDFLNSHPQRWQRRGAEFIGLVNVRRRTIAKQEGNMRFCLAATLLLLTASLVFAQDPAKRSLCDAASTTTIDRDAGVIIQKVMLSGKWGHNEAMFYMPDKEIADGAVLLSHSAIHADTGASVDLLPFALTLAHAGAAVIVPERSLIWPPTESAMNREGAVVICAEHWLIDNSKIFNNGEPTLKTVNDKNIVVREGYAYVGPRLCDPAIPSDCEFLDPFLAEDCALRRYCRTSLFGVPMGEIEGGDNTRDILSDGGLWAARAIQKQLGLSPIKELVTVISSSSGS